MERAFARYRRSGQLLAVLFLDVDRFKQVNDVHGHEVGDILLQAFAQRLQQLVREIDTVARLGGDEFVILLEDLPSVDVACTVAAKVVEAMRVPFAQGDHELQVGTSIGIAALTSPDLTPDEIVSRADNAMYQAKSAGRNTFRLFQP
jgi:diguanylate cyclase (GGDEF)-like protein